PAPAWQAAAAAAGTAGITVSPRHLRPDRRRGRCHRRRCRSSRRRNSIAGPSGLGFCPDQIDSSEETALKQEAYSARLTAHWDSQFGVQDAIEAYFKSQIVAPSPAGFDNGKGGGRSRPEEPHVDSGTECAPKWNGGRTIAAASRPLTGRLSPVAVRPSPPLADLAVAHLTPDRVVKAFQVLPSSGSPQLGQQTRPKLQRQTSSLWRLSKERSYCSMDTTSDSQPASVFCCTSSLQQQQQQRMAASSYGEGSSFLTGSSGSMSRSGCHPHWLRRQLATQRRMRLRGC
uniref:DUF3719 domain-containing protein n=1 Tax=Macrostomum lignano TaxID=282301 RepID=A0A1I8FQL7_9PLAT